MFELYYYTILTFGKANIFAFCTVSVRENVITLYRLFRYNCCVLEMGIFLLFTKLVIFVSFIKFINCRWRRHFLVYAYPVLMASAVLLLTFFFPAVNGEQENRVQKGNGYFQVPPHTPVIFGEAGGRTLFRYRDSKV